MPESLSQLGLTFFGLTTDSIGEYRKNLFTEIHEIVFYGNGGYDWGTVYSLSIPIRKFVYKKIVEHYENMNKKSTPQNPNTQNLVDPSKIIKSPPKTTKYQ